MTILYGAGISNSTRTFRRQPAAAAGGRRRRDGSRAAGISSMPTNRRMANLLVTMMDKMDVPVDKVGGSNGKLPLDPLAGASEDATGRFRLSLRYL